MGREGEAAIGGSREGDANIGGGGGGGEGERGEGGRLPSSSSFVIGFENEIRADTTFARDIFHRFHAVLSFFFSSFVGAGGEAKVVFAGGGVMR